MLTEEFIDFNKSLTYIKNCALSNINGDCQLIEKIKGKPLLNPYYIFELFEGVQKGGSPLFQ